MTDRHPEAPSRTPRRSRPLRPAAKLLPWVTVVTGLALAAGIWLDHRAEMADRDALAALAARHHVPETAPGEPFAESLRRLPDTDEARLAVARRLVARGLEPYSPGAVEQTVTDLAQGGELAREVLHRRPASWEAATLAGAAVYLSWSWRADRRLVTEYHAWEEPLLLAHRLAPGKPEPEKFLAAAYLELWPALSAEKKAFAGELVAGAFRDALVFDRLIDPWLATYDPRQPDDLARLFAAVPERANAWSRLLDRFAAARDWPTFCRAWQEREDALEVELRERIEAALVRRRAAEHRQAESWLYGVMVAAPRRLRYVPLVSEALARATPEPATARRAAAAAAWLAWNRDLCELSGGDLCPLDATTAGRLATIAGPAAARGGSGDRGARGDASGRSVWSAAAWTRDTTDSAPFHRLDLTPVDGSRGLLLALDEVPGDGTAVDIRIDGESLGCRPVVPSVPPSGNRATTRAILEIERIEPPAGRPFGGVAHRLEIETLGLGRVEPGELVAEPGG